MFEYHGWIMVRDTTGEEGEDEQIDTIYSLLQKRIESYAWDIGLLDIRWINLYPHICVAGLNNHKSGYGSDVFDLFSYVAKIAPGSYGLLYTMDDEIGENKFRVYVLARGKIEEQADPFLSPFVPVVEDPS